MSAWVAGGVGVAAAVWVFMFVPARQGIWTRTAIGAAVLIAYATVALVRAGQLSNAVGSVTAEAVAAGIGVGAAWLVATHIGHRLLCRMVPSFIDQVRDLYAIAVGDATWSVFAPIVAMAFAEELFFRGFLQHESGFAIGIAVYAAIQLVERKWALVLAALGGGAVWGALFWWQDGVVAPFLAHAIWTVGLTFLWPLRGCGKHELPEAAAVAVTGSRT